MLFFWKELFWDLYVVFLDVKEVVFFSFYSTLIFLMVITYSCEYTKM